MKRPDTGRIIPNPNLEKGVKSELENNLLILSENPTSLPSIKLELLLTKELTAKYSTKSLTNSNPFYNIVDTSPKR